jgi:hypothetical protein
VLTYVVISAVPFQLTVAPETKFVPVTVSVKAAPPAVAEAGETVVTVGIPALMVKDAVAEVPPEFVTVTLAVPTLAMSLAGTAAVSCVVLTYVVVSAVPFQLSVAPETKFVPVTVSVKAAPPAVAVVGESVVMVGVELLTVKGWPLLGTPPTVTTTLPVIAPVGTVATIAPGFQLMMVAATPPKVAVLEPCDEPKFDPEMVTEVPTGPEAVLRAVITGAELVMVNVAPDEAPAESVTVTVAEPAVAIRLAGTAAISCVEFANVVVSGVLPQSTVAPEAKFVPFTVSAKPALPETTDAGKRLAMVGAPTANVEPVGVLPEEEPSESFTDTVIDPAVATRLAGTAACSSVELTKVVVNAVPLDCVSSRETAYALRIAMFLIGTAVEAELAVSAVLSHSTVAPGVKFVP